MSRRDMKVLWLLSGLFCLAIGLALVAHENGASGPDPVSMSRERTGLASPSLAPENKTAQEKQNFAVQKPRVVEASVSPDSAVAGLPSAETTPFLDPDGESVPVSQIDINRTSLDVGEYLNVNIGSLPLSENNVSGIEQTSINTAGEYLDPDHKPHEPIAASNGDSANTHSDVGHYLDPETESPEALSVVPLNQKNIGSFLEVDI